MRKSLLLAVIILSVLSARAQSETDSLVTLAKVNYVGITEFLGWAQFSDDDPIDQVEAHPDGIAITNTNLKTQAWQPQVMIVPDSIFDLEQGHDYIVRLTVKVPSDGTYMVNIGNWSINHVAYATVKASDEFQIIDVEYPEYQGIVKGGHVLFGCGWVKGTTIIKEVEVLERKGYWLNDVFIEFTSDTICNYKYVQAMNDESLNTLNDLLAGKRMTDDEAIIKFENNRFFVHNDYSLPEGDYYASEIYKMTDIYQDEKRTVYILPAITVLLNEGFQIDDILNQIDNHVKLECFPMGDNKFYLQCQVKTSEEVLEALRELNHLYISGNYGISYYSPHTLGTIVHPNDLPDIYDLDPFDKNGIRLIYEKDWSNEWLSPNTGDDDYSYEETDEGLAITIHQLKESLWQPWTFITNGEISFEEGHDYIVRLTIRVPSDGTFGMILGSVLNGQNGLNREVPVTAGKDFQVIDVDFPDFVGNTWGDGYIILCNGWVAGTTVLKKVQVFEKQKGGEAAIKPMMTVTPDDAIYNLSGQRVSPSYKGILIRKGRKVVKSFHNNL